MCLVAFRPVDLQLTPVNESILLENLDMFRRNGFEFSIDLNGEQICMFQQSDPIISRQCFDTVGWATGRTSGL